MRFTQLVFSVLASICAAGVISGCIATVRTEIFPDKHTKSGSSERASIQPPQLQGVETAGNNNGDTTVRRLEFPSHTKSVENDLRPSERVPALAQDFDNALVLFDGEQYNDACGEFDIISQTLPEGDSLQLEAQFMLAECALVRGGYLEGLEVLYRLSLLSGIPEEIREKTLVRLGHAYCLIDDAQSAQDAFDALKREFPGSSYIRLANCSAVR